MKERQSFMDRLRALEGMVYYALIAFIVARRSAEFVQFLLWVLETPDPAEDAGPEGT